MVRTAFALGLVAIVSTDPPSRLTGGVRVHEVVAGDMLSSLGARSGVEPATLARDNHLTGNAKLAAGTRLVVDNRHIVPGGAGDGILINVPQRMLFVLRAGTAVAAFPVAVGRGDWRTPLGAYAVTSKEIDPVWDVPVSIQREMARAGHTILTRVMPGENNPLGGHWIGLSAPGVGIHGTNQPTSIYRFTTHGCIRLHSDDAAALFDLVDIGTPAHLIYEPVLLARADGGVFLEVHPDPYRRMKATGAQVAELLRRESQERLLTTAAVQRVISERAARAVLVGPE